MKKKLLAALLATAMTVTMFAGCGTPGSKDSKKDDSSASSGKKRITYTLREDLPSMDPQNSNSISCATAEICTYAMLTRNVEGEIKPDAAESWDISDDGLTYTFHLRDGLKWSDGEDVKAGDYVYGIQRLMDPEMASDYAFIGYILKNGAEVNSGSVPVDELGVSAPDDKTVVIELAHPATYFLSMAAMATFGPTRKDYVEKYGKEIEVSPVFPERTNTEFVQLVSREHIKMRVWERGSGETLACGTGTCASVVACVLKGLTERKVKVDLLGGTLYIEWNEEDNHVYMTGPAEFSFDGEWLK